MSLMSPMQRPSAKKGSSHGAAAQGTRLLVSVNVMGSAGPIRFVVGEADLVGSVMATALRSYARQGRLPVLGSDLHDFLFYSGSDALSLWEPIGSQGSRNFLLCKKHGVSTEAKPKMSQHARKKRMWRSWLNKSLSFKVSFN